MKVRLVLKAVVRGEKGGCEVSVEVGGDDGGEVDGEAGGSKGGMNDFELWWFLLLMDR